MVLSCHIERDAKHVLSINKSKGVLTIQSDGETLLGYHYGHKFPPKGVDKAFKRSGFIHPVNTLEGHTLTRIQPDDHYHHFGIWNPWTRVAFEGDTLDFWNIGGKQATIRFAEFKDISVRKDYAEYQALHEHVVLRNDQNKVALNEIQTIRIHHFKTHTYIIDLTFDYSCATESPFHILTHTYAGLGWRGTEEWNHLNSEIITSEGKTRDDADHSTARWFMYQGDLGNDIGGMVMMSHPDNFSHPEPLRVWPKDKHEGNVFANFDPVRNQDWLIEPGETCTLKYRFLVFDGRMDVEEANIAWERFSQRR